MKKSFTIHDLPISERPRERLQKLGIGSLIGSGDSGFDSGSWCCR